MDFCSILLWRPCKASRNVVSGCWSWQPGAQSLRRGVILSLHAGAIGGVCQSVLCWLTGPAEDCIWVLVLGFYIGFVGILHCEAVVALLEGDETTPECDNSSSDTAVQLLSQVVSSVDLGSGKTPTPPCKYSCERLLLPWCPI